MRADTAGKLKMSDKLQFVVAFGSGRMAKTSDKLKFVGHFQRHFALLLSLPAVSGLAALHRPRRFMRALHILASIREHSCLFVAKLPQPQNPLAPVFFKHHHRRVVGRIISPSPIYRACRQALAEM
jgi:hypothetical protein